jgi:hypothetical protein
MIKERINYKVVELLLVMKLRFFRNIKRLLPAGDFFVGLAAIMPKPAVINKKLAGDRFSFVGK